MASPKAIAQELAKVARQIYQSPDRGLLTVNHARRVVEEKLKLEDGFLKRGDWKLKSKQIIYETVNEIDRASDDQTVQKHTPFPEKTPNTPPERRGAVSKRSTKAAATSGIASEDERASDAPSTPEPPTKRRKTAKAPRGRSNAVFGDVDDKIGVSTPQMKRLPGSGYIPPFSSDEGTKSKASNPTSEMEPAPNSAAGDDESELSEVVDEPRKREQKSNPKTAAMEPTTPAADEDSSSELSSVIDEPPSQKRKRKSTDAASRSSKPTSGGAAAPHPAKSKSKSAATSDLSPDEAQIKTLQSQLAKCGVRKVWASEFKKCGADTPRAKIQHLREMLAEVGMKGRFSEAKARKIRETRELQADLQEVMQGEKNWGIPDGGRGTRRRAAATAGAVSGRGRRGAKVKEESEEEEEEEEDDDDDGEARDDGSGGDESDESDEGAGSKPALYARRRGRRRADALAFLDDESESE